MTGRLLAQLAEVAYRDAVALHERGTLQHPAEYERDSVDGPARDLAVDHLCDLSERLLSDAIERGFCDDPFGDEP